MILIHDHDVSDPSLKQGLLAVNYWNTVVSPVDQRLKKAHKIWVK